LTSERPAATKDTISSYHVSMTSAHTTLVQACLGVRLHLDKSITGASLEYFPLPKYASRHWVDHARFGNVASTTHDGIKRLFLIQAKATFQSGYGYTIRKITRVDTSGLNAREGSGQHRYIMLLSVACMTLLRSRSWSIHRT
jgi:hypothetical protein